MITNGFAGTFLLLPTMCLAQTIDGLAGSDSNTSLNMQYLTQRQTTVKRTNQGHVVVFPGDRVIAQFVDGGYWKTSVFLVNLENHPTAFQVLFFNDNGTDLYVPVVGQGTIRGINITLGTAQSIEFETTGASSNLAQGWALLSQSTTDAVGGMAIFRQSVPGHSSQEAVVPIVSQFDNHFVLLFDNTSFTTAIALANPTPLAVTIPVNIRNQLGQILDRRTIALGAYSHTAFTVPDAWPASAGQRGVLEFQTSGFGVAALGLRFSDNAFTSFNVLENFSWLP